MYVVTFKEYYSSLKRWIESYRIFDDLNEAKDFVEFIYETNEGQFREVHVWKANEITHRTYVRVDFIKE